MTSPDDVPLDGPRDGSRDDSRDDPSQGTPEGPFGPAFDEDAAWRMIVENYGERPQIGGTAADPRPPSPVDPAPPVEPLARDDRDPSARSDEDRNLFDRAYLDAVESGYHGPAEAPVDGGRDRIGDEVGDGDGGSRQRRSDDHDHFVPPEPPPVPKGTPARRLAWVGLFAPPLLMILAVVFGWALPTWLSMLLVAGFVGGFVFLVMTMPRDGGDGWGDGAVV
jgi:hypothetical protein